MKKLISLVLVLVSLFTILCCCPVPAAAVGEKITLISQKTGRIDVGKTKSFRFNVPASSKVKLAFIGYYEDEDYEEYRTSGKVLIQIKSDGVLYFYKEASFNEKSANYTVNLEKGEYTLYLTENTYIPKSNDEDDWDDWDFWDDEDGFEYYFKVTATLLEDIQPTYLILNRTKITLSVGKTFALVGEYAPANATVEPVWTSSNKKVATVDTYGGVTAKAFGKAKITLKLGKKAASCVVYVISNNNPVSVFPGKTVSLQNRLANVPGYNKAKWASSNNAVAPVSKAGVVIGKAKGSAIITAAVNGVKYTQKNKVKNPSVALDQTTATIYKGDHSSVSGTTITLKATTDPANKAVTWTSSNTRVAKVSEKGKVTPVAPGTATIKASFKLDGKTYSNRCTVTVKSKKALTAKVTSISQESIYNECYIEFQNNTNKTITYIRFNIKQYDNRGYRLSSPYDYYYLNESIKANSKDTYYFWVNEDTKSAKVTITKVWFSDGTTYKPS